MILRRQQRRGTIVVEAALVYPVLFLLVFAIIILSLAVFRHQQVSHLAREAARWASVRGQQYGIDTGNAPATADDVYNVCIKPRAVSFDLVRANCTIAWPNGNAQKRNAVSADGQTVVVTANTVEVTITYPYQTGIFGTITMTSKAVVPVSY